MRRVLLANHRWRASQAASSDGGGFDAIPYRTEPAVLEAKPVVAEGAEAEEVGRASDDGKARRAQYLHGLHPFVAREIQLHRLRGGAEVGDDEDRLALVLAVIGEHGMVAWPEELDGAASEGGRGAPGRDEALHHVEEREVVRLLRRHVHRLVAVD